MKTQIYNVRDINEYWERLDKELEILIMHMLRDRYEYGTDVMCSESGIQQSLAHYATKIAQNEGLNVVKTRCICQAIGLCFPEYGSIGLKIIKEYLADESIDDVDIKTLEIDAIEKKMATYHVADSLDEIWKVVNRANKYIDETTPWVLAKDELQLPRLGTVLYNLVETIRIIVLIISGRPIVTDILHIIHTGTFANPSCGEENRTQFL